MRKIILLLLVIILFISWKNERPIAKSENWSNAQWITFEKLQDNMLIIPGVHGLGAQLGNKGLKRSIVPMFRKDFSITDSIESALINICGLGHYELYINNHYCPTKIIKEGVLPKGFPQML